MRSGFNRSSAASSIARPIDPSQKHLGFVGILLNGVAIAGLGLFATACAGHQTLPPDSGTLSVIEEPATVAIEPSADAPYPAQGPSLSQPHNLAQPAETLRAAGPPQTVAAESVLENRTKSAFPVPNEGARPDAELGAVADGQATPVIGRTESESDTVGVDENAGATIETATVVDPIEETVVSDRIELASGSPPDSRRLFAGPEQIPPRDNGAYAILAIRADTPVSDRDRIRMICSAFVAARTAKPDTTIDSAKSMVTIWPVASAEQADELNRASRADNCTKAVNQYGLAIAHRAILDTESTGWVLDNPGPYVLARVPGSANGGLDARVLMLDLTSLRSSTQVTEVMESWSELERDTSLLTPEGWNTPAVQARIGDWRRRHGRSLILLGPNEG